MSNIIMSTESINAIRDNRKSVTRRVIKPQPEYNVFSSITEGEAHWKEYRYGNIITMYCHRKLRYKVGDILWVRETWAMDEMFPEDISYKADFTEKQQKELFTDMGTTWRSPMFMPRSIARLFLKITDIRVERLQDITEEQAKMEGVELMSTPNIAGKGRSYVQGYGELWDKLNAKRGYSWANNDWLWVIEFERCGAE